MGKILATFQQLLDGGADFRSATYQLSWSKIMTPVLMALATVLYFDFQIIKAKVLGETVAEGVKGFCSIDLKQYGVPPCVCNHLVLAFTVFVINYIQILLWSRGSAFFHSMWIRALRSQYVHADGGIVDTHMVSFNGRPNESPLTFEKARDEEYYSKHKISFLHFVEMYRHGECHLKEGLDMQAVVREAKTWSHQGLTYYYLYFILFGYIPDVFFHTAHQDENQVKDHYNFGNDFFNWYLGPSMCYTSGYFNDESESLETSQYQKITTVLRIST